MHILADLTANRTTRGAIAEKLYQGQVFDYALPQGWVDKYQPRYPYGNIAGGFVWLYPSGSTFGMPAPLFQEAFDWLAETYDYAPNLSHCPWT